MQFTTVLASLVLAATSVHALPGSPVQERQATPTIYARFYPDTGCNGQWVDDTVYVESTGTNACVNNTITASIKSTFFSGNIATRTLRVYSQPGCPATGNYFDLPAGTNNCYAQTVGSARFL
ncbi:hypothetical protein BDV95DRAFT_609678 [Massariosphaeria phaeospora]|uniref:Uncharacterized protein n=1 Tax=Massariosphaeria phaeospora TaxID=100035 RepID=A0A7C8I9W1_9PLEO|nr:hypothetical protein BDV95DRAFT_609678 [Massariosphaeria phaeospora]